MISRVWGYTPCFIFMCGLANSGSRPFNYIEHSPQRNIIAHSDLPTKISLNVEAIMYVHLLHVWCDRQKL